MSDTEKALDARGAAMGDGSHSPTAMETPVDAHSPLPWRLDGHGGDRYLRDADGKALCCDMQYYPWCFDRDGDWRLVVRACNAHHELVAALKESQVLMQAFLNGRVAVLDVDARITANIELLAKVNQ
jgi:hypothetical protein